MNFSRDIEPLQIFKARSFYRNLAIDHNRNGTGVRPPSLLTNVARLHLHMRLIVPTVNNVTVFEHKLLWVDVLNTVTACTE